MLNGSDLVMVLLLLLSVILLGSSRFAACIRAVALQGVLLSVLPLAIHGGNSLHVWLFLFGTAVLKGVLFPFLLFWAIRETEASRESKPFVGYVVSLGWGALAFVISLWLGSRLPIPAGSGTGLDVSVALFTIWVGFFLIVSRREALSQVLGYLVLENGIYAFGVVLAFEEPLLVEFGILLDVFVAVFVMGIVVFHISREFDHIDTERLSVLKE